MVLSVDGDVPVEDSVIKSVDAEQREKLREMCAELQGEVRRATSEYSFGSDVVFDERPNLGFDLGMLMHRVGDLLGELSELFNSVEFEGHSVSPSGAVSPESTGVAT